MIQNISHALRGTSVITALIIASACTRSGEHAGQTIADDSISLWLTTGDKSALLKKVEGAVNVITDTTGIPVIKIDTTQKFQTIDGFGYALTGGSAYLLNQKIDFTHRDALLKELFLADENNIGISYLRISIGSSDLDDHVFTYNDLPAGKKDVELKKFSLSPDQKDLIPVLKQVIKLNPDIKIMGSPWSAPAWMKTNNSLKGGSLKPEYYEAYAHYFVKYIQGMAAEGINIDAITLQNEPENPNNNPSMLMTAEEQAAFVKNNLGPAFERAGIKTKIVVFDHNCDHPEYPITVLNDAGAKKYIDGSAFHLYLGKIEALSKVHETHPDKNLYFTEQWTSSQGKFSDDLQWHTKYLVIGSTRNWSCNVLEWNLAADLQFNPHTDQGGCTMCQGALTVGDSVTRNVSYYIIAHASKFVRPGSVRIASNIASHFFNVAFITPSGQKVLVVVNDSDSKGKFAFTAKGKIEQVELPAGAVATLVW